VKQLAASLTRINNVVGIASAPTIQTRELRMKKIALIAATTMMVIFAAGSALAGANDPGVKASQHRQHDRIGQGVRSGEITPSEAKSLRQEQRAICTEERAYKSDGVLTRAERRDLRQDQKQVSRHIYNQKHDDEKRVP
jgi:hypothetical protein